MVNIQEEYLTRMARIKANGTNGISYSCDSFYSELFVFSSLCSLYLLVP